MPATFSVLARKPPSWPPPSSTGNTFHAVFHVEGTHSFRPVQLVGGERKQMDRVLLHVEQNVPAACTASV